MSYVSTQRWRVKAKQWLVKYSGGKCQSCGYDKYHGNFAWHHLRDKKAAMARLINRCSSWNDIIEEADKCVMVCHNCHGEIHAGIRACPEVNVDNRKAAMAAIGPQRPIPTSHKFTYCHECGRPTKGNKFCSWKCQCQYANKIKWPDDLAGLVANETIEVVADKMGISPVLVNKRLHAKRCRCGKLMRRGNTCRECALIKREKITWPDNLPELIKNSSYRAVAISLGVSDKAVAKRIKNHYGTLHA